MTAGHVFFLVNNCFYLKKLKLKKEWKKKKTENALLRFDIVHVSQRIESVKFKQKGKHTNVT